MSYRTRIIGAITVLCSGAALVASAPLLTSTPASANVARPMSRTVGPTADIVGKGLVNCHVATGEVGYSPKISSTGSAKAIEWVSIWFFATKCSGGPAASPVPRSIIGAMAFRAIPHGTTCPQFGHLGKGLLYLTYNYAGVVPNPMIDPSVAVATVTEYGPFWHLHGKIIAGSYRVAPYKFDIGIYPTLIGGHGCDNGGIDSEYINRLAAPYFLTHV